jgi:PAS domain S-box-containing protein
MTDPTPRRKSDAAERWIIERGRAAHALAIAQMGEFEWNFLRDEFTISPRMSQITGIPAGSISAQRGEAIYACVHPEDVLELRELVTERLDVEGRYQVRYRLIRPDTGAVRWMESVASIVLGPKGPIPKLIGVVWDITERQSIEQERNALVAELDHRVKNVLASVKSLAIQSARKTVSLDAFLKTFTGRLDAMASAHTLLTANRWRGAAIVDIAAAELGGLAFGRARWRGPDIVLEPRATSALTLALHELASNAVKYGALSIDSGRVEITWTARPTGGFDLVWVERGGPLVVEPTHRGFGATLLEKVTSRELGGEVTLEFLADGLRATVRADARALADPPPPDPTPSLHEAPRETGTSKGEAADGDIRDVRVLIVEDAVLLALELEAGLTEAGAHVVATASDLTEASTMVNLPFDVAVLDVNLKGLSILPVALALQARGAPFVFATGYDDGAMPDGFDVPVVRKPYNINQISAALAHALGRK